MGNRISFRRNSRSGTRSAPSTPSGGGLKDISRLHSEFFRSISHEFARNSVASPFTATDTSVESSSEVSKPLSGDGNTGELDSTSLSTTSKSSVERHPKRKPTPAASMVGRTRMNFRLSRAQTVMIRKSWDLATRMGACEPGLSILYGLMERDRGARAVYENACYGDRENPIKLDSFLCGYSMKLTNVLAHVIDELHQLPMVESLLRVLGKRHAQFTTIPLRPRQWEIFAEVLVEVVLKCGARSNPVTRDGWCRLSLFIVSTMQEAYDMEFKRRQLEMVAEVTKINEKSEDTINQQQRQHEQNTKFLEQKEHSQSEFNTDNWKNIHEQVAMENFKTKHSLDSNLRRYSVQSQGATNVGFHFESVVSKVSPCVGRCSSLGITGRGKQSLGRSSRRRSCHIGHSLSLERYSDSLSQLDENDELQNETSARKLDRNRNFCASLRPKSSHALSCICAEPPSQRHANIKLTRSGGSRLSRNIMDDSDLRKNSILFLGSAVPKVLTSPDLRALSRSHTPKYSRSRSYSSATGAQ